MFCKMASSWPIWSHCAGTVWYSRPPVHSVMGLLGLVDFAIWKVKIYPILLFYTDWSLDMSFILRKKRFKIKHTMFAKLFGVKTCHQNESRNGKSSDLSRNFKNIYKTPCLNVKRKTRPANKKILRSNGTWASHSGKKHTQTKWKQTKQVTYNLGHQLDL